MNGMYLYEAIGGIHPVYVEEAEKQSFAKPLWRRMLPVAACLAVILGLSAALLHRSGADVTTLIPQPPQAAAPGADAPAHDPTEVSLFLCWLAVGGVILGNGIILVKSRTKPKLRQLRSGIRTFWIVAGIQILYLIPFVLIRNMTRIPDSYRDGFYSMYVLVLIPVSIGLFVMYLRATPREKLSWGVPLGVTMFPILFTLTNHGELISAFTLYYQAVWWTTLISTAVLKYQSRKGI